MCSHVYVHGFVCVCKCVIVRARELGLIGACCWPGLTRAGSQRLKRKQSEGKVQGNLPP